MGRVLTNNITLQYAKEDMSADLGTLPGSPVWKELEPNAINTFGSTITTVPRDPISKNRQRRKGSVTDLDSSVEFDADLTLDSFIDFIEGFCFAQFTGADVASPTAAETTGDSYTIPASPVFPTLAQNTLVYVRGFVNSENNGLKVVDTGASPTSVPVTDNLVDETPASTRNATLEVAGFRSATGDLDINADGNITSTALDFTTLPIVVGQMVHVGGSAAINRFTNSANFGFARVTAIAANLLTLDKKSQTFVTEANTTQAVDLLFGRFIKNVPVDDANFQSQSFQFEAAYPNLDNPSGDRYEYAKGNFCNTAGFELPLTNKATVSFAFVGTDTEPPVASGSRATNAASPLAPVQTGAFNTSADIARLRITQIDETGLTTDFKSVTLNINNNVSPEKVLGRLGAKFMNTGNFEIDMESQLIFTDYRVVEAIRSNETLTLDFVITNDDGAIAVDIPALTLGGGDREFPVNESVLVNTTAQAFGDATFNASLIVSLFPFVPSS